jgi:hypothetical protein
VDVANLPSRIGWWEGPPFGGGEWHFEYRGGSAEFQQAIDAFGKIKAPVLDLFVHDGTRNSFVFDPNHETATNNVDWSFTVWVPTAWQTLYGPGKPILFSDDPNAGKPMPAPRLDLYLGGNAPVTFDKLRLPANVQLHDQRASTAGVDITAGTVLRVRMSDLRSGLPLPGGQVIVTGRNEKGQYDAPVSSAQSDTDGVTLLTAIPAGTYQISAGAPGYVEAVIGYGDYSEARLEKFEVALAEAGSVSGRVIDEKGIGVPELRVQAANTLIAMDVPYRALHKPETVTDAAGRFTLDGLPVGLVQIWIQSTDYFHTDMFAYHKVPATDITIPVRPCGSLLVRIVDADGNGIQKWNEQPIQVSVERTAGAVRGSWGGGADVESDGTYLFRGVHPDTYTVSVSNASKQSRVSVQPRQRAEVVFQLP